MRNEYNANLTLAQIASLKNRERESHKRAMRSAYRLGVDPYNSAIDYGRAAERQFKDRCRRQG